MKLLQLLLLLLVFSAVSCIRGDNTEASEWEVTLFEHYFFKGRQITLGSRGKSQHCQSLNNTNLCTWGNGNDCISASNSVSSIQFRRGECLNVFRDLHCYGTPLELRDNTQSKPDPDKLFCHVNVDRKACQFN